VTEARGLDIKARKKIYGRVQCPWLHAIAMWCAQSTSEEKEGFMMMDVGLE
jgi:hypothetical protein